MYTLLFPTDFDVLYIYGMKIKIDTWLILDKEPLTRV